MLNYCLNSKFGKKTKQSFYLYVCVSEHAKSNVLTVMSDEKSNKNV